jgi:nitrite reductase/ring-hydroxylating ferredoxin subunit
MRGLGWRTIVVATAVIAGSIAALVVVRNSSSVSPWVDVASVEELQRERVMYLEEGEVFVVMSGDGVVAFRAQAPHVDDDRVLYCPSSGWFEGKHGEKFDGLGRYALGPGSGELPRVAARVDGDTVQVDPTVPVETPPRGAPTTKPVGPFCSSDGRVTPAETQPGFLAAPTA